MRSDIENKTTSTKFTNALVVLYLVSNSNFTGVSGVVVSGYQGCVLKKKRTNTPCFFYGLHVVCYP